MALLFWLFLTIICLIPFLISLSGKQHNPVFLRKQRRLEHTEDLPIEIADAAKPCFFRMRKKPQWVIGKLIYLKAINPSFGCRKIAELFDRIHGSKDNMTVSKSYVYNVLRNHRYEVQVLRRQIKHTRPQSLKKNICWGLDLTTVTDTNSTRLTVFAIVDYSSRRCVCLQKINSKSSLTLLFYLFRTIAFCGKPKSLKTDNEAVFVSALFRGSLTLAGIKHQRTDIASPWQNGRIERLSTAISN